MNNTFTNNTAVGGLFGFWFSMPEKPTGLSAAKYAADTRLRPLCQPILQFDDNTAHGYVTRYFWLLIMLFKLCSKWISL